MHHQIIILITKQLLEGLGDLSLVPVTLCALPTHTRSPSDPQQAACGQGRRSSRFRLPSSQTCFLIKHTNALKIDAAGYQLQIGTREQDSLPGI